MVLVRDETHARDGDHADDDYVPVDDDAELPDDDRAVIVSLTRWKNDRAALCGRAGALGVVLQPDDRPDDIAEDLTFFSTVVINFPVFSDGRGFSHARRLREAMGYRGDIRAAGHIIRDQYLFLHRCGVNVFDVADRAAAREWQAAMKEFSLFYQNTVDSREPLMRMRQK